MRKQLENAQKNQKNAAKKRKIGTQKMKKKMFFVLRYFGNENSYYKSAGGKKTRFSVQLQNFGK